MSTTVQLPPQNPKRSSPGPKSFSLTNDQIEINILKLQMAELEKDFAALGEILEKGGESATDKIAAITEKVSAIREQLKILQQAIFGEPHLFLPGIGIQVKNMNAVLEGLQKGEEARGNQIKGVKVTLYVVGIIAGIPALQAIIPLLGKIAGGF